ncbi:Derlin [Piptocephalis cylindrospora]|uniref:Derlin n=1 Tax=Piptocephalis cylindrospora TaxID=1907219 RepID=A0A4P9Y334_9FUNG|nr:Derlin [Piptocephalis cylindrospora]|eukprot:RKP13328.1 Derlin [Piptocephalis cylindrospora]
MATPIDWFKELPPVTRVFVLCTTVVTLAVQLKLVDWYHLFYNGSLVFRTGQYWRLVTTFLYFGNFSLDWVFHMYFTVRYSRLLEETWFRHRVSDYVWLNLFACISLLILEPFSKNPFLGYTLTYVIVYLWSRREPYARMNFMGLFIFRAPYLPWVLLMFNFLISGQFPVSHLQGIGIGHIYFFLEDIWPRQGGRRWMKTPRWL